MSTPATMKESTAKVLRLLRARPQTTGDFAREFCPRASARIHELRKLWGCEIEVERIESNAYRFTLRYEPPELPVRGGSPLSVPVADPVAAPPSPSPPAVEQQLFDTVEIDIPPVAGYADAEAA